MQNGDFMPLSMEDKLPTMIDCPIDYNFLEANTKYYLVWESGDGVELAIDPFRIEADPNKASRYTADCFRPKSPMEVKWGDTDSKLTFVNFIFLTQKLKPNYLDQNFLNLFF